MMTSPSFVHFESLYYLLWLLQLATHQRTFNYGNEGINRPSIGISSAIKQDSIDAAQQPSTSRLLLNPDCPGGCLFRSTKYATCHKTSRCPRGTSCAYSQPSGQVCSQGRRYAPVRIMAYGLPAKVHSAILGLEG